MKKINLLKWGFLCLFCMLTTMVGATIVEVNDETSSYFTSSDKVDAAFTCAKGTNSASFFTSGKGSATINGTVYSAGLKVESATTVAFSTTEANTVLTVVFGDEDAEQAAIQLSLCNNDDEGATVATLNAIDGNVIIDTIANAGSYILKRASSKEIHIFYMGLSSLSNASNYVVTFDPDGPGDYASNYSVESLSSIKVACAGSSTDITKNSSCTESITISGVDSDEKTIDLTSNSISWDDNSSSIVLTTEITEEGTYTITIPKDYFTLGTSGSNSAFTLVYDVKAPVTHEDPTEAWWDFENGIPEGITDTNIQETTGTVASTIDGISLTVDATYEGDSNGKFSYSSGKCQMNANTTIQIPVGSTSDVITVTLSQNGGYTIGSTTVSSDLTATYSPSDDEVSQGYVELSATGAIYFYSLYVKYDSEDEVAKVIANSATYTEAVWDIAQNIPEGIQSITAIRKGTGYVNSDVDGIQMYVDATYQDPDDEDTYAKFGPSANGNAQFLVGTILRIPVVNEGDVVSFKGYSGLLYSVCGSDTLTANGSDAYDYTATADDVENGFVQIESYGGEYGGYMYSVKVEFATTITGATIANSIDMSAIAAAKPDYSTEPDAVVLTITSKSDDLKESTLEKISDTEGEESTITVSATNMDQYDGAGIYFAITYQATDEDGNEYTAILTDKWLDADTETDADGNTVNTGTYTWTCGWGYNLDKDVVYTFSITPKAQKNNANSEDIGDAVSLTITGTYEAVTATMTADPTDKITADGEAKTITLTFSKAVKVTSAQMSTGTRFNPITEDLTVEEKTEAATEWTITVSADYMEEAAESGYMSLVIYAEDENGTTVCDANNDNADNFSLYYDIESELAWTFDPEDESPVESLSTIIVTCEDGIAYQEDKIITITNGDGNPVEGVTVSCADDVEEGSYDTATSCTITISPAITTEGTYTITIPEATFYVGGDMVDCPETTLTYYVSAEGDQTETEPATYELTITPDGTAKVDSIATITIEEANGQELALQGWEYDVVVTDALGDTIASGIKNSIDIDDPENCEYILTDQDGTVYGYIVPLDSIITTAGTYYITIPEEFVVYGEGATDGNDEITITVEVSGNASGIKGVTLRATNDDRFYNLNGQRVTSPRNGVYILNGKKVLIK